MALYTDLIEQIKASDEFGEAMSHLQDRKYSEAKKKYDEIDSVEGARNSLVSASVHGLEDSIESAFCNYRIREIKFNRNEFYNLTFIINAFKRTSPSHTTPPLIEDDKPISGEYYTTFTLTGLPVAQCRTYRKYQIRQLINIGLAKSAESMKQIENNMNKIQSIVDEFEKEIKKIIHDADRSGLKGECNLEVQEWKFFHCKRFPLRGGQ